MDTASANAWFNLPTEFLKLIWVTGQVPWKWVFSLKLYGLIFLQPDAFFVAQPMVSKHWRHRVPGKQSVTVQWIQSAVAIETNDECEHSA